MSSASGRRGVHPAASRRSPRCRWRPRGGWPGARRPRGVRPGGRATTGRCRRRSRRRPGRGRRAAHRAPARAAVPGTARPARRCGGRTGPGRALPGTGDGMTRPARVSWRPTESRAPGSSQRSSFGPAAPTEGERRTASRRRARAVGSGALSSVRSQRCSTASSASCRDARRSARNARRAARAARAARDARRAARAARAARVPGALLGMPETLPWTLPAPVGRAVPDSARARLRVSLPGSPGRGR